MDCFVKVLQSVSLINSKAQKYAHAGGIQAQVIESKVMGGE